MFGNLHYGLVLLSFIQVCGGDSANQHGAGDLWLNFREGKIVVRFCKSRFTVIDITNFDFELGARRSWLLAMISHWNNSLSEFLSKAPIDFYGLLIIFTLDFERVLVRFLANAVDIEHSGENNLIFDQFKNSFAILQ